MPTYTVAVHAIALDRNALLLDATLEGIRFQRRITRTKLTDEAGDFDRTKAAEWILAQRGHTATMEPIRVDTERSIWRGLLMIETTVGTVDGQEIEVVNTVTPAPFKRDDAADAIRQMPGWATWTAAEAESWVETNVTDLASAKQALIAMARLLVFLRDRSLS